LYKSDFVLKNNSIPMHKVSFLALIFLLPILASAHVTVRPSEVGVGAYQTFNVSVPTEKDIATTEVRLLIPQGLESVRPNVKAGWNVEIVRDGEGEGSQVREIIWRGGSIPADQRDDFFFSAKTPAEAGALRWDAYQTYSDGTVVAWDADASEQPKDETGADEFSVRGPYSTTRVINDLTNKTEPTVEKEVVVMKMYEKKHGGDTVPDPWVFVALIMAGMSLIFSIRGTIKTSGVLKNPNA